MREAPGMHDPTVLPPNLPVPEDDGAARHLTGMKIPDVTLPATTGPAVKPRETHRAHRPLRLPAHGRSRRRCAARLGRYPRRPRLHAAIVRLSRSFQRTQSARRRCGLWIVNAGQRLSARSGAAASSAVPASVRCRFETENRNWPAEFFHIRHNSIQTHGDGARGRRDHARFLSGISA